MRVLMTGGGTAGHINPALAIAETIRTNDPIAEIEFVGVQNGKEVDLVPKEGYRLHFVRVMGFRRSLSLKGYATSARRRSEVAPLLRTSAYPRALKSSASRYSATVLLSRA